MLHISRPKLWDDQNGPSTEARRPAPTVSTSPYSHWALSCCISPVKRNTSSWEGGRKGSKPGVRVCYGGNHEAIFASKLVCPHDISNSCHLFRFVWFLQGGSNYKQKQRLVRTRETNWTRIFTWSRTKPEPEYCPTYWTWKKNFSFR